MHAKPILLAALLAGCATTGPVGGLGIERMIVAAVPNAGDDSAAYMLFDNDGAADRLVGAQCACAEQVEIHHLVGEGNAREMRVEPGFEIPANAESVIAPPGLQWHLMLRNVRHPIPAGSRVDITLTFEKAGSRTLSFQAVEETRAAWDAMAGD